MFMVMWKRESNDLMKATNLGFPFAKFGSTGRLWPCRVNDTW